MEQFIARCANSQDPQKLVDVVDKIGHIDIPLEQLEEHIKQKQAEKETLLREIDEARAVKNYIKQLGAVDEGRVEQFIARCANSQDPQKLVDVVDKIGHIDIPLEQLEEHIKQKQAEKETLLREIDEARAVIDSVNVDRQIIEDFKELKNEMDKYHLEDPKKFLNVLRPVKRYKYDDKRIVAEFSIRRSMKKVKWAIEK